MHTPVFPKAIRSSHLVMAANFLAFLLLVTTCNRIHDDNLSGVVHYSGRAFAGSETCGECHPSIADSHAQTPHFLTSRPASPATVKGSFDSAENVFNLDERVKVVMEKTDSGLFQVGLVDDQEINRKRMDITIGSGRKGQTYLYWDSNALFQLPVSYYTPLDIWCNSPGYPTSQILFNRNIQARCLECHSTFFRLEKKAGGRETFDKDQTMLGVDCERCHGPAADHVSFHRKYPAESEPEHVINPARLTRKQKLDNCALCHSGARENLLPSFTFLPGDNLDDFFFPDNPVDSTTPLEVHGNQYGLLSASKCFQMSPMDCSSCHDVHAAESNKLELFSARCMTCHTVGGDRSCKQPEVHGLTLTKNCIDCHMPALPSRKVFLQAPDTFATTPFLVRTHVIGTYKTQVKLFLERINKENPVQGK